MKEFMKKKDLLKKPVEHIDIKKINAADIIRAMNRSGCPVYSVDIPSGLNSDTGEISGSAVKASKTLALGLPKKGFYLANGPDCVGDVRVLDIGIPPRLLEPYLH